MDAMLNHSPENLRVLLEEIRNFQDIAHQLVPGSGSVPALNGIDMDGLCLPLNGVLGGDHLIYLDFSQRYDLEGRILDARLSGNPEVAVELAASRHRAGILLADVSGHRYTDAVLTAMLHQAFLLGVQYELDFSGTITTRLFEHINSRFYHSSAVNKFVTMIYGEIVEDGTFRFISAGHPLPIVFSNEYDRIMEIGVDRLKVFPPIGTLPGREDIDARRCPSVLGEKEQYTVNEISLMGNGDILLLYTDGFADHSNRSGEPFSRIRLEPLLRDLKHLPAREICLALRDELFRFADPGDDISYVVIKKF